MEAANQKDSGLGGVFGFCSYTYCTLIRFGSSKTSVADLRCVTFVHIHLEYLDKGVIFWTRVSCARVIL